MLHISDTAVLDAEQRRWGSQLVQECWMHQELHNVRWNEQRLLKHGAAYRPRAIASRTAVTMSQTKSLCIALNVDAAIIENAGETQVTEDGEEGSSEAARMPSLSSPDAEGWSPLLMWRSPALTPGDASTVLTQLSECLSEQYEGLAPRPLPTSCCANSRPSDLVQTLSDARKDAGEAKVIFHYLARGVPPPHGGNLYLVNTAAGANGFTGPPYSKLSLDTFRSRVGFPLVFIADCAEAREILNYYIRMCEEQHQQRYFTSSREYQLKSSRQVSAAELDGLVDNQMGAAGGSFDRVGSGTDLSASDALRCGRGGLGGMDNTPPTPQSAMLQDFYFIGASGSSNAVGNGGTSGGGGGSGVSLRDKSMIGAGGGGYDDCSASSSNLSRGGGGGFGVTAVSGDAGALRHHVRLPSDILTSCLTTPLRMAVLWFIAERPELQELHPLLLRLFPGALTDKKTPLGQLQWYLQSIIECIAWSTLSLSEYSRLFREDVYVAPLFRGYILAERIIVGGLGGCLSVYPPVAATHSHTLWSTWDNLVERACVSVLRVVHPAPPRCASVLEFRGWLDEQVTSWKYTRPDLLAVAAAQAGVPSTSVFGDGRHACLPSAPDEAAVIMPSLLIESLRGLQAWLDGITQQSFERPRVFFAEIVGLQPSHSHSSPPSAAWDTGRDGGGSGDECKTGPLTRRQQRRTPASGQALRADRAASARRMGSLRLRDVADRYANSLRSSYPAPQQQDGGAFTPAGSGVAGRGGVSTAASVASVGKLLSGHRDVPADGVRRLSPRTVRAAGQQQQSVGGGADGAADGGGAAKRHRGMSERVDSRTALPPGRYQRALQGNLTGLSGSTAAAADAGTTTPTSSPVAAARMEARRSPSRLSGRKADYVANLYTYSNTSGQAASFQYTAGLNSARAGGELFMGAAVPPPPLQQQQQHTFPFMDRMPLLLQALLVAAHREKATELLCRLVDCGPAAVLQCAEANIYRFVLDRYWSRPDLRFLMPATLFIYCKSCYADPELIGNPKQRDVAVKACAEILQSPVKVPTPASSAGVAAEEEPGAWQNTTLGPYATPYGQRMLAAALLTLIALHSDDGREACHSHGVFQLCCQLLQRAREDTPLLLMKNLEMAAAAAGAAPCPPSSSSMPPLPRPPSSTLGSNVSFSSPLQAQSRAANAGATAGAATATVTAAEEPPPPPCIATTYHVTLLTLFVSLLCNWKPSTPTPNDEGGEEGDDNGDGDGVSAAVLKPPLDGVVHELSPTTPQGLAAGLRAASAALLNFTYSDTSILRGAALRCFMMVLISPAPSQLSRDNCVEVVLRFIQGETFHRCELNTDLRLEELGMAYTTFRWLLDQLREDLPIEEIGQYVAVWMYKWFRLNVEGKTVASPFAAPGLASGGFPQTQQQQQSLGLLYPSSARTQWMPPTSMSYRGSSVVTPGSVYSHRGSNVLVPAARSVYGGATHDGSGAAISGSLVSALGGGLRQHLTQQNHRRLQSCLPPLSNIVRLFFEHTQDACPYVRTYARKVVTEEFGFLRQSWYDDYAAHDLHTSPREDDYGVGGAHNHHYNHHTSQRRRSYGARHDAMAELHLSGDVVGPAAGGGLGALAMADPLTASSIDGGGDLSTYLPFRDMLSAGAVFDEVAGGGGAGNGGGPRLNHYASSSSVLHGGGAVNATAGGTHAFHIAAATVPASAPTAMATEIDDVPDPQPAVLRRFIGRLLRIASSNGAEMVGSSPSSFPRNASRHRLDGGRDGGMRVDTHVGAAEDDGGDRRSGGGGGGYPRSDGCDGENEGSYAGGRGERGDSRHWRGSTALQRGGTSGGGDRDRLGEDSYYSDDDGEDDDDDNNTERELDGMLLDCETLALHPLWAMDSTSMTNFAYGALSFLERFMLEKMDDSDPRHPMNLEKENALHHYFQRVERNIRALAQDEMPSAEAAQTTPQEGAVAPANDVTAAGGRLSSSPVAPAPAPFLYLGVGDIRRAGVPDHSQRRGGLRGRDRDDGVSRVSGSVDVVLFHPSEPLVITSTTGGLLSVWTYDHLGLPTTAGADEAERAHGHGEDDGEAASGEEDDDVNAQDGEAAEPPPPRQPRVAHGGSAIAPPRRLHAKAQFFLRDVVGRSRSDLYSVAQPRYMYDRFNPNGEASAPRAEGGVGSQRRSLRGNVHTRRGAWEREAARHPSNFHRRDEMAGGAGRSRSGAWMDRAEAANVLAALPSSYLDGQPHYCHGVGDLHLVDAAHHPLICAVRRFGAVEVFSHFTDRHRVRRVATFETARFGQNEGVDHCVSSYQSCTGLLYVSNGKGAVSAWDLGNEQRLATLGVMAGADSLSAVGAGSVSALKANPCTPYEYLVGSYDKQVCLFDLRDGSSGAARLGYAHPSLLFSFASASLLSSVCVRVCYSRRYPEAVVAGYACGTVAVWDRRYPKQPSLLFGAALNGATAAMPAESGPLMMIRQLDVHPCSKRFLTLATTPTTLQLVQPCHRSGDSVIAGPSERADGGVGPVFQRRSPPACVVQSYDLRPGRADDRGPGSAGSEGQDCEPGAACFHEFSPVLCVGVGGSVRLYGTSHLSTMATYMDVDGV